MTDVRAIQYHILHVNCNVATDHVRNKREGNVFTGVCDSVHRGKGYASSPGQVRWEPSPLSQQPWPGRWGT